MSQKRKYKPGEVPPNRIAIVDHLGNVRGHCGLTGTQSLVSRFGIGRDAKLVRSEENGRLEWRGQNPRKASR
jgi:hypothetical protein